MRRIGIIGAGHAGVQVAASLREEGFEGEVILFGAETELPYHRPPLSKDFLADKNADLRYLRPADFYVRNRIELQLGISVSSIDLSPHLAISTGERSVPVDAMVVALGSDARRMNVPGARLGGIHVLRDAADAVRLRQCLSSDGPVVVVGGGLIGLEVAAGIATKGRSVTVVESAAHVLSRMIPSEFADILEEMHRLRGVTFRVRSGVQSFVGCAHVEGVLLDTGEILPARTVIIAIGSQARTELVQAAGLACTDGIEVDARMQTSTPNVFAVGDCASAFRPELGRAVRLESIQSATEQARNVARSVLGKVPALPAVPWFWSDQGSIKLQIAGIPQPNLHTVLCRGSDGNRCTLLGFARDQLAYVLTLNAPGVHMAARRAIAARLRLDPAQADDPRFDFQEWCRSSAAIRVNAAHGYAA